MLVLLIEDDVTVAAAIALCLESYKPGKFHVDKAATLRSGLDKLSVTRYEVIVLDLNLPDSYGVNSLLAIREQSPTPVVVVSGENEDDTALACLTHGAQDFLVKGNFNAVELGQRVRFAYLRAAYDELGKSTRMLSEQTSRMTEEIRSFRTLGEGDDARTIPEGAAGPERSSGVPSAVGRNEEPDVRHADPDR